MPNKPLRTSKQRVILYRVLLYAFFTLCVVIILLLGLLVAQTLRMRVAGDETVHFVHRHGYYVAQNPFMIETSFPARKPAGAFRVFLLGGSQAMGTPYVHQRRSTAGLFSLLSLPNRGGIATWVKDYLSKLYPERTIEVINAAKGAQDLGASLATLRDIVKIGDADLVIILSGNNERPSEKLTRKFRLESGYWSEADRLLAELSQTFSQNLSACVDLLQAHNIPGYICTVPTNIRDWLPSDADDAHIQQAKKLLAEKRYQQVVDLLSPLTKPGGNALHAYYLAKAWDGLKQYDRAKTWYIAAKDADKSFLRARSPWNNAVRDIPEHPLIRVVDLERLYYRDCRQGLPGLAEFADYCHLKLPGYQRLALYLSECMVEDFFSPADKPRLAAIKLDNILPSQLKRLYQIKKLKWLRMRYHAQNKQVRDENVRRVMDNFQRDMQELDIQIQLLKHTQRELEDR